MCRGIVLIFPAFFPLDREVFLGFLHLIFPAFFPLDREVFWVFLYHFVDSSLVYFFLFYRERGWGFLKGLDIESSEYLWTNISGGGASVTPNEALPHIGRHTMA